MSFLPEGYDLDKTWKEVKTPLKHPAFTTHSNYLDCLRALSERLEVTIKVSQLNPTKESSYVKKKVKLIELTKENIDEEYQKICSFKDYSQICVSWIPVKSYYLFFNLISILLYLIDNNEVWFTTKGNHTKIHRKLVGLIRNGELVFSNKAFNTIYSARQISKWKKVPPGSNVKTKDKDNTQIERLAIGILLKYKKEDFKQKIDKKKLCEPNKSKFLDSTTVNLCEFFYWYRIKANYRDMEFIESDVPIEEFFAFYKNYYLLTINFFDALKPVLNELASKRLKRNVLK